MSGTNAYMVANLLEKVGNTFQKVTRTKSCQPR